MAAAGAVREEAIFGAAWPMAVGYFAAALVFLAAARFGRPLPDEGRE